MNKRFIWTIIFLLIIGGAIYFLLRDKKVEEEVETEETQVQDEQPFVEYEYDGDTDFSTFSTEEQTVGEESEAEFAITNLENTSEDGYHEFVFTLESEQDDQPFVTAKYMPSTGVIRLDFQGISGDDTGIGYQQEERIDENGILRIYHNVSAQQDQELYDIGVSKKTPFKLITESQEDGKWSVILQIKYPGETSLDADFGSDEFSAEDQSILGLGAEQGASIISYTYGNPGGILKMIWNVSSDGDNPIPSVEASYNEDGDLIVTFESLEIDRVANFSETLTLSSGITATPERTGETTVYRFTGMSEDSEFRLSASLSPNQVILEIR